MNEMSGWLSRARDALSGRTAEIVPEPIQIPCPCGRTIETTRRESFQRVLCKTCGEPFFILPLDVYPRPVMKKVRPAKTPKNTPTTKSAASTDRTRIRESEGISAPVVTVPKIDLKQTLMKATRVIRRQFTATRIIVLGLLFVVGATGWWQWNRAALSRAEGDYKIAVEAGNTALQKNDLLAAAQEFERATTAVDLLRRKDIAAEQARQRLRELTAVNALLQASLPEILVSSRQTKEKSDAGTAESNFAHLHSGRWIVLQTEIAWSSKDSKTFSWEQRVQIDESVMSINANLTAFSKIPVSLLPAASEPLVVAEPADQKEPARAKDPANAPQNADSNAEISTEDSAHREFIFAAQIKSLRWNVQRSEWDLELNPNTGFLWSNYDLLIAAGLVPDEIRSEAQIKVMLLEQSRWIGAAP